MRYIDMDGEGVSKWQEHEGEPKLPLNALLYALFLLLRGGLLLFLSTVALYRCFG
ncbi:hypothetical protein PHLH7_20060 [Pseudomonas sp. Ost2]|nr:hypothetical protein PHLH7_20060 [Pseudomonas sp. Ost2]